MQTLSHQAEQTIAYQQARLSAYTPLLLKRLARTYLIPFFALMIAYLVINIVGGFMPALVGSVLGSVISLVVFMAVLFISYRFAENRWHGTALFLNYTAVGKARRLLEAELATENPADVVIQGYMSDYIQLVDSFIETMHDHQLIPEVTEIN